MKKVVSSGGIVIKHEGENKLICLVELTPPMNDFVFPKGHVENDETFEETALREVGEETGLINLSIVKKLGVVTRDSTETDGTKVIKDIHLYLLQTNNYAQKTADEKYAWFSYEDALDRLAFQEEKNFLKQHWRDIIIK